MNAFYVHGQTVEVHEAQSGNPLEYVTIHGSATEHSTSTGSDGKASLSKFKEEDTLTFRLMGYQKKKIPFPALKRRGYQVTLVSQPLGLGEVVVSANRWRQSASKVPTKVTSITPDKLALQNPQTAADMLDASGEVFVQKSQQGGGSPMIRGFATNRLLYTVDGVRMNTAIFRGGNIQNVISLDPFATEKTEVSFGPGSVIYGSDALGGVMAFKTLTPELSQGDSARVTGKAVTRYSSANNERTAHLDINVGWENWSLLSSISSNDYEHLKMGSHGPDAYLKDYYVKRIDSTDRVIRNKDPELQRPSGYSQINLMQKVRFRPNQHWDLEYGFHYSETSDYARYDRHLRKRNGKPRYGQWDYGPQKWLMHNLIVTHEKSSPFYNEVTARLAKQHFEESRIDRTFGAPIQRNRIEDIGAWSGNLDFTRSLTEHNDLFYGLEFVRNDVHSTAFFRNINTGNTRGAPTRYPEATWRSYALYLTDRWDVTEQFTLQGGLRYNRFDVDAEFDTSFYAFPFTEAELENGAPTGKLGFTYRPKDAWVIKGKLSTGFRAPNVDDVGKVFDSEPGSVVVPNPDLGAEQAYNADLGITKVFADRVKVDITSYYTWLQDAMVRRESTLGGADSIDYDGVKSQVLAVQNAAEARIIGVQAGLEVQLPEGFEFSSQFNFQDGVEVLDDGSTSPLRHSAPAFGVSRFTYNKDGTRLQLYARYQEEVSYDELSNSGKGKPELYIPDGNGNHYAPGWYTLNFKAMHQLTDRLTVSGGVENITDQRYRPYSSGINGPGRNFIISLRADF